MKLFKLIDGYTQLFLVIAAFAVNLFLEFVHQFDYDILIFSYLIVGGLQVCSVIANFMAPPMYKMTLRKIYLLLLALTVFTGIVFWQFQAILIFGLIIFFWAPVMAIIYAVTCYRETKLLEQTVA